MTNTGSDTKMETTYYSLEEIRKNNGKNGAKTWLIYKDGVYDVTTYLQEHPGGDDLISEWAGKDCTKAFDDFGHSSTAKKEFKSLKIGEVREEDRKQKQQPKVVDAPTDPEVRRSCLSVITCGMF